MFCVHVTTPWIKKKKLFFEKNLLCEINGAVIVKGDFLEKNPTTYIGKKFNRELVVTNNYVSIKSKSAYPLTGQTYGHLNFEEKFGQIPYYFTSCHGQIPCREGLHKASIIVVV